MKKTLLLILSFFIVATGLFAARTRAYTQKVVDPNSLLANLQFPDVNNTSATSAPGYNVSAWVTSRPTEVISTQTHTATMIRLYRFGNGTTVPYDTRIYLQFSAWATDWSAGETVRVQVVNNNVAPAITDYWELTIPDNLTSALTITTPVELNLWPVAVDQTLTLTSNPTGQPIYMDGGATGHVTPWEFMSPAAGSVFTVMNPLYTWAPLSYEVPADFETDTLHFVGTEIDTYTYKVNVNGPNDYAVAHVNFPGTTDYVAQADNEAALLGAYTIAEAPAGWHWAVNPIEVVAGGWTQTSPLPGKAVYGARSNGAKVAYVFEKTIEFVLVENPPEYDVPAGVPTPVGDVVITSTGNLDLVAVAPDAPALALLPSLTEPGATQVIGLAGSGTVNLTFAIGPSTWYGMLYVSGSWYQGIPFPLIGPGSIVFSGVSLDAKGEVVFVAKEGSDPSLQDNVIVIDGAGELSEAPTGSSMISNVPFPTHFTGVDTGLPAKTYQIASNGIQDVTVTRPNAYPTSWWAWISIGGSVLGATNPITTDTYTFTNVEFDSKGQVVMVVDDNHTLLYFEGQVMLSYPLFSPSEGTYTSPLAVELNTMTSPMGATLRYTLDGTEPNEVTSLVYSTPIILSSTGTINIRVRAFYTNWQASDIGSANYTLIHAGEAPSAAQNPVPGNSATNVAIDASLSWIAGGGTVEGYRVYLGTDNPPTNLVNGTTQTATTYNPADLAYGTTFYWKIVPYNQFGDAVDCPVWSFTTSTNPVVDITSHLTFSTRTGTYTPITGTAVTDMLSDDAISAAIPIGFSFPYGENSYTEVKISSNGWIGLGASQTGSNLTNNLSSTTIVPVIAPLWDDCNMASGNVVYALSGESPNRVLTIQYSNIRWNYNGPFGFSHQTRLYENGSVSIIYGPSSSNPTGASASIGLNMLPGGAGWYYSVTPGTPATASMTAENTAIAVYPADGTIYEFNPVVAQANDLAGISVTGNTTPTAGIASTYTVVIRNRGTNPQSTYTVKLVNQAGTELASVAGTAIQPGTNATFDLNWTPTTAGAATIYGKVVLTSDQNATNDQTSGLAIVTQPIGIQAVTIGAGDQTSRIPVDMYYKNSLYQTLYMADELGFVTGIISSVKFYNNFVTNVSNKPTKIWLGSTTLSDLSAGWIPSTQMTLVYNGAVNYPLGQNTITIPFTTPYTHTVGNLVMMVQRPMDSQYYSSSDVFFTQTEGTTRARNLFSDTSAHDPTNPTGGTVSGSFPKTTFIFEGWGALTGTVYEGTTPLPGATVSVTGTLLTTTTNANGQYNFPYVMEGNYNVVATKHGYTQVSMPVVIVEDQTTTQNITIAQLPQVTVTGMVVGSDQPTVGLVGAVIELSGYEPYTATTVAGGTFTIPNVYASQTYEYVVRYQGYQNASGQAVVGTTNLNMGTITVNEIAFPASQVVATEAADFSNVVVTWAEPGTAGGEWLSYCGEKDDRVMVGYKVWRLLAANQGNEAAWTSLTPTPITANTHQDTSWASVPDGTYIWAVKAIYSGGIESSPTFSNQISKASNGAISGSVTNAISGSPIEGVSVVAGEYQTFTNSLGQFELQVAPGTYTVTCSKEGYSSTVINNVVVTTQNTTNIQISMSWINVNPEPAQNPIPNDSAVISIFDGSEPLSYLLEWEQPAGPVPSGYKIVWNGLAPIDIGNTTSWTTPALGAGSYSWQVIPYIYSPTYMQSDVVDIDDKSGERISMRGDAQNCPVWTFTIVSGPNYPLLERTALILLFNSTGGANWTNRSNWLTHEPLDTWYGITVLNGRVTEIRLPNNNLQGTIPPSIGGSAELELAISLIDLSNNNLIGTLPPEVSYLSGLMYLDISSNSLTGELPQQYGNLDRLLYLALNNNQLQGAIPNTFNNLSSLVTLKLENNLLNSLPALTGLESLQYFSIYDNDLTFEDLEINPSLAEQYIYSPQHNVFEPLNIQIDEDLSYTLDAVIGGTTNLYQWYKDSIPFSTTGLTLLDNLQAQDSGVYTCVITNDLVPGLAIHRNPVTLAVNAINDIPTINLPEIISIPQNESLTLDFSDYVDDQDNDTLVLSINGQQNVSVQIEGLIVTFMPSTNWVGTEEIVFTVDDNQLGVGRSTERVTASDWVQLQVDNPLTIDFIAFNDYNNNLVEGDPTTAVTFEATSNLDITSWEWDFDSDGVVESNLPEPVHFYSTEGFKSVSLTASDGVHVTTLIKPNYLLVHPGVAIPPSEINQNIVWTEQGGPYNLLGEILLNSGYSLTIEPNAQVNLLVDSLLVINGSLLATQANFSSYGEGGWSGILLGPSASNSTIQGINVSGASTGITINDSSPTISNLNLTGNTTRREPTRALVISGSAAPVLSDITINNFNYGIVANNPGATPVNLNIDNLQFDRGTAESQSTDTAIDISGNYQVIIDQAIIQGYINGLRIESTNQSRARARLTNTRVIKTESSNRDASIGIALYNLSQVEVVGDSLRGYNTGILISGTQSSPSQYQISDCHLSRNSQFAGSERGLKLLGYGVGSIDSLAVTGYYTAIDFNGNHQSSIQHSIFQNCGSVVNNELNPLPVSLTKSIAYRDEAYNSNQSLPAFCFTSSAGNTLSRNTISGFPRFIDSSNSTVNLNHTIAWTPNPSNNVINATGASTVLAEYCDIALPAGVFPGIGNLNLDPMFNNLALGDFGLYVYSPCIDAGNPALPFDPDGSISDIGAVTFDWTTAPLIADFNVNETSGQKPLTVSFSDHSTRNSISWEWDFNGDGLTDSVEQSPSWTYYAAGQYSVNLTVFDGQRYASKICPNLIQVLNTLPQISSEIQDITLSEDFDDIIIDLASHVIDINGDPIQFEVSLDTESIINASITGSILTISSLAEQIGTTNVTITATEATPRALAPATRSKAVVLQSTIPRATLNFVVNVSPVNDAPQISLLPSYSFAEDDTLELDLSTNISDIDSDNLTISVFDTESLICNVTDHNLTITAPLNWFGSEEITVTVQDERSRLSASATTLINVLPVNDPPQIISYSPADSLISITLGSELHFSVTSEDIDSELSYQWYLNGELQDATEDEYSHTFSSSGTQLIMVRVVDECSFCSVTWEVQVPVSNQDNTIIPPVSGLCSIYPNPGRTKVTIAYGTDKELLNRIEVYNTRGQLVRSLLNDVLRPGYYDVIWDGKDQGGNALSSGVYFIRFSNSCKSEVRKMILLQ